MFLTSSLSLTHQIVNPDIGIAFPDNTSEKCPYIFKAVQGLRCRILPLKACPLGIVGFPNFNDKQDISAQGRLRSLEEKQADRGECFQHLPVSISVHQAVRSALISDNAGVKHPFPFCIRHRQDDCPGDDKRIVSDLDGHRQSAGPVVRTGGYLSPLSPRLLDMPLPLPQYITKFFRGHA